MAKRGKDDLLLWTIRRVFLDPLAEFDFISDEEKLYQCFGHPHREIYKRRILKRFRLEGAWWGEGLDKSFASRAIKFNANTPIYCYVREDGEVFDVEIRINTSSRTRNGFKHRMEWRTCTLDKGQYKNLDSVLGPCEPCCCKPSHKDDDDDYLEGFGIEGAS